MQLSHQFIKFIDKEELFHPADKLILAVSGGVDSIVLTHLCKQAFLNISIAHCNFQLRGEASDKDEQLVRDLAKKYDLGLAVKRLDTMDYVREKKVSVQVAARELRYTWFMELAHIENAYIVTAHHADDNIETLLMNFFKGTGIQGLTAMAPKNGIVIRPLLFAYKKDILAYAEEYKLQYLEDASNAEDKYTRNYFRNQLLPGIAEVFPQVKINLTSNIRRFSDISILYHEAVDHHIRKLVEVKNQEIHIPILKLKKVNALATIIYELTKPFGFTPLQIQGIIDLLDAPSGKYLQSDSHRILRNRNWLIISSIESRIANTIIIEEENRSVQYIDGSVEFTEFPDVKEYKPSSEKTVACLDRNKIIYPLILRRWKTGDYFYPLGMNKKKKVSRFLIDQKVSLGDKEKIWLLEMDKKIIWIVGMRIDDRFRITKDTKDVLEICFQASSFIP